MEFSSPYWTEKQKMELLQRWILVHSYLYYDLNTNVVSDHMFDQNSKQLINLQTRYKNIFKQTRYYYAMKDFDGSSGFGFVQRLNAHDFECITRDVNMLLKTVKERQG